MTALNRVALACGAALIMATAALGALRTAVEVWAASDDEVSLPDLARESLAQLRAGIPLGDAAPTT